VLVSDTHVTVWPVRHWCSWFRRRPVPKPAGM